MEYVLTDTSVVQISESSGVIQNNSSYEILLSETDDFAESFVLKERQEISFNKQLYIKTRDYTPHSVKVNVVPFSLAGGTVSEIDKTCLKLENIPSNQIKITDRFFALMKKHGLNFKAIDGAWLELGARWTVEFFIQAKNPVKEFTEIPAVHFMLVDKNYNTLSLTASRGLKTSEGYPVESLYAGTLDADKYFYEPTEITLLDGQRHHVNIQVTNYTVLEENVETEKSIIACFIDGNGLDGGRKIDIGLKDFRTLTFGGDAFLSNPCVENFVTFDEISVYKSTINVPPLSATVYSAEPISVGIVGDRLITYINGQPTFGVVPDELGATEDSVIFYQGGVLTIFANTTEPEEETTGGDDP